MTSSAMTFSQIKTRRVFEEICEQIRTQLGSGQLGPGDKLPSERDLADKFKVGRPAVREAMRTLEMAGVIELRKGVKGGAFVCEGNPALFTHALRDLMSLRNVTLTKLAEARLAINRAVCELACGLATREDIAAIRKNIEAIENTDSLSFRAHAGVEFFGLIARATDNDVLIMIVDATNEIMRAVIDQAGRIPLPELVPVRRRVLQAIVDGDAEAGTAAIEDYFSIVIRKLPTAEKKKARAKSETSLLRRNKTSSDGSNAVRRRP